MYSLCYVVINYQCLCFKNVSTAIYLAKNMYPLCTMLCSYLYIYIYRGTFKWECFLMWEMRGWNNNPLIKLYGCDLIYSLVCHVTLFADYQTLSHKKKKTHFFNSSRWRFNSHHHSSLLTLLAFNLNPSNISIPLCYCSKDYCSLWVNWSYLTLRHAFAHVLCRRCVVPRISPTVGHYQSLSRSWVTPYFSIIYI
jgi:hypothetical protein